MLVYQRVTFPPTRWPRWPQHFASDLCEKKKISEPLLAFTAALEAPVVCAAKVPKAALFKAATVGWAYGTSENGEKIWENEIEDHEKMEMCWAIWKILLNFHGLEPSIRD